MQVRADHLMHGRIGVGNVAIHLLLRDALRGKAKGARIGVARLRFEFAEIDGAAIEPARGAGLKAGQFESAR